VIQVGGTVGNYKVLQKIGAGAMGNVFLAEHPVIGKRVALKVIHPELASNEEMIARFFNEARAVTQIGHQNIVDVQDFGQTPDGDSFIVMELLEGSSLGDKLKAEGTLSVPRAVHIAIQLADGLSAAHARGIIHRDLKPDNIFLIQRGGDPDFVKLLDFGLAKLTGPSSQAMNHQTKTGSLLGTPHYMAPEQAENVKKVDHRADVYSLGCILFQVLTGRVPFPGEGFGEVLVRHVREPPPLPSRLNPAVSPALEKIVLHALAKKPEFRFSSMDEFRTALRDPERFAQSLDGQGGMRLTPDQPMAAVAPQLGGNFAVGAPPPVGHYGPPQLTPGVPGPRVSQDAKTMLAQPAPDLAAIQRAAAAQAAAARPAAGNGAAARRPDPQHVVQPRRERSPAAQPLRPGAGRSRLGLAIAVGLAIVATGSVAGYFAFGRGGRIVVTIVTTPAGAAAFDGETPLGETPLVASLERGSEPHILTFKKDGFLSAQRKVVAQANAKLDVKLLPKPAPEAEEAAPPEPLPTAAAPVASPVAKAAPPVAKAAPPVAKVAAPPRPAASSAPSGKLPLDDDAPLADKAAPKKHHPPKLRKEDTLILTPSF
jgi:eukaryotic-like serine/threonine-protein kinase